jgi:hypothetical protein
MPARFDARVLLVAPAGPESFTYPQLYRRALERLGCQVDLVDLDYGKGWGRLLGIRTLAPRLRRGLARHDPSLVLVLDDLPLEAEVIAALRRVSPARWVLWATGEMSLARCAALQATGTAYDALFVGSSSARDALDSNGFPPVMYLPDGCDPSVHRPMRSRDQFRANVVFAGRATPHRERFLSTLVGFGLALWGPGWRRTSLKDYCRGERLSMSDYVRAYSGAFVGVNIHREDPTLAGEGCNRRLFELAAIGVPQAVDESADLRRHFTPETEVLFYRGERELKELVRLMLESPKDTAAVAEVARRRALGEHTLMHRLNLLLHDVLVARPVAPTRPAPEPRPAERVRPSRAAEPSRTAYSLYR